MPRKDWYKNQSKLGNIMNGYTELFNRNKSVEELIDKLESELHTMLCSCLRYKTARIQIKGLITFEDEKEYKGIYDTYDYKYKRDNYGYKRDDSRSGFILTRRKGIRYWGSSDSNNLNLFSIHNFEMDGDLYEFEEDDKVPQRVAHFNRLRDLAKETKNCKVVPENVENFMHWLNVLMQFKFKLLPYMNEKRVGFYYLSDKGIYSSDRLLASIISESNDSFNSESFMSFLKKQLQQHRDTRNSAIDKGKALLKEIHEQNKLFVVEESLKNASKIR